MPRYKLLRPGEDPTRQVNPYPKISWAPILAGLLLCMVCSGIAAGFIFIPRLQANTGGPTATASPYLSPTASPTSTQDVNYIRVTVVMIVTPGPTALTIPQTEIVVITATATDTPGPGPAATASPTPVESTPEGP